MQQASDVVEHGPGLGADAARDGAVRARFAADLAGEEDKPTGLDDLAEREIARLDAGQRRDGLRHGGLLWAGLM